MPETTTATTPSATAEQEQHTCHWCGLRDATHCVPLVRSHSHTSEVMLCDDCYADHTYCDACGELVFCSDNAYSPSDDGYGPENVLCGGCHGQRYTRCVACGCTSPRDQVHVVYPLGAHCEDCYHDRYIMCASCNRTVPQAEVWYVAGDDDPYCERCAQERRGVIRGYHSQNKAKRFFREEDEDRGTTTFVGLEIEIEVPEHDDPEDMASAMAANLPEYFGYFENDSSIEHGFEFITAPMSLRFLDDQGAVLLGQALGIAARMGGRSHDTTTCGLHIHMSENFLGEFQSEIDMTEAKLLYLTEKFSDDLLILSRRDKENLEYCEPSDFKPGTVGVADEMVRNQKYYGNRRKIWNLTLRGNIEYRFNRGTLKLDTVLASVDLAVALATAARKLSVSEAQSMDTLRAVLEIGGMTDRLAAYMDTRMGAA